MNLRFLAADQLLDLAIEVLHSFSRADAHSIEQRFAFGLALFHILSRTQSG